MDVNCREFRRGFRAAVVVGLLGIVVSLVPNQSHAAKAVSQNVAIVKNVYAGFERGDVESVAALMDENVDWFIPGPTTIPFAGSFKGREGVRRFFTIAVDLLTVRDQHVNEYIVHGDKVIALGFEDLEVKASGKSYRSNWAHVFTIRKGKIVKFEEYVDTAAQAAAFDH